MFKKTVLSSLFITVLGGCSSMSGQDIATLDRDEMSHSLKEQCQVLGQEYTPVSYAVDKTSQILVSIQDRQCSVFEHYSTLSSKHGDVTGFLAVNADKSDEDLLAAMDEFDVDKPEDKKIRPQVEAYKNASESIFDSNVQLAGEITLQVAEIGLIAADNAVVIAQETGLALFSNIISSAAQDEESETQTPIVAAYDEMMARSELAYNANSLISLDQNTIKQLENLDKILAEQLN
ncbi:hypothetical protein RCJ22_26740 [Vibrio sp. FNV 38]|nr:hypothetical protein [Vibrio sp. FNV 38]